MDEVPAPTQAPAVALHDLSADVKGADDAGTPVMIQHARLIELPPCLVPLQENG